MQINALVKVTIQFGLLLKNNYPLLTNIRTRMTCRKHFHNFEEILLAVEGDCLIFVEHLIACQKLLLLVPRHFNIIDVVMVLEGFKFPSILSTPTKIGFVKYLRLLLPQTFSSKRFFL